MQTRFLVLVATATVVALCTPGAADAHDLQGVVKLPPSDLTVLIVEAGFDDETPAEGATVRLLEAGGTLVAEGKTDEKGVWKTTRPGKGKYVVKVESLGHADRIEFEIVGTGDYEFAGWRFDKTLGLAIGVGGLLVASGGFWWFRLRKAG
jgi:nickel transport protein